MSFSGDLRGIGLSDVFQNVSANRLDGTLCVRWRRDERYVRFEGGAVTGFSLGIGRGLPLGDHLRERGYVDPAELDRVLARGRRSRKPASLLCVEAGLLDDDAVRRAIAERVEEGLFELFGLRDAAFEFTEGPSPARVFDNEQTRVGLRLEIGPVLMEAARRRDEGERIQKVVTSHDDVFVLLEGWDERVDDEFALQVAELLDGRASVGSVATALGGSPFHVKKAVHELVQAGAARPSTAEELAVAAEDELAAGATDEALRLMARALELARSDSDLRVRHAELLEQAGRRGDAAVEHARLGHDAERAGDPVAARAAYDRAVALAPDDLALQEKRLAVLEQEANDEELAAAVLALVARHAEMGLADRSRGLLAGVVERRGLGDREDLVSALARVESSLGHWKEAAALYRGLGERALGRDEERGLELLRAALEQDPEDPDLRRRVDELDSGRAVRRLARRRRLTTAAALVAVLSAFGFVGFAELQTARRAAAALSKGLGELADGEGVDALAELAALRESHGFTTTAGAIPGWIERLADLQLDAIRAHVRDARYDEAEAICAKLTATLDRPDLRATCAALGERIARERAAFGILTRVERQRNRPSVADLAELEALGVPEHLGFLVERLPEVRDHQVRAALLRALGRIDDPRSFPAVARLLLRASDDATRVAAREVLRGASSHRLAGREGDWAEVYGDLERALLDPSRAGVAREALSLLRGS